MSIVLCRPKEELVFYTQRNNFWNPSGACFPTTMTMAMRNNGIEKHPLGDTLKGILIDDVISMLCNTGQVGRVVASKVGISSKIQKLNLYWLVEEAVARYILNGLSFGNQHNANNAVRFLSSISVEDIKREIDRGYGVVVRIPMRNKVTGARRSGGHILLLVGDDSDDSGFYFLDPYGDWNTFYKNTSGFLVRYSKNVMYNWIGSKGILSTCMFVHSDLKPIQS
jgi:hypothetical protein